jgi:phytoene/squalene synthetase
MVADMRHLILALFACLLVAADPVDTTKLAELSRASTAAQAARLAAFTAAQEAEIALGRERDVVTRALGAWAATQAWQPSTRTFPFDEEGQRNAEFVRAYNRNLFEGKGKLTRFHASLLRQIAIANDIPWMIAATKMLRN